MKLNIDRTIMEATLVEARARGFQPLAVAVLDERGAVRALATEDGTSLKRAEIAIGKELGAIAMGVGSRELAKRRPHFLAAVIHAVGGLFVPVPGGVLLRGTDSDLLGAGGVSGDTSDNDEIAAVAGIRCAGYLADPGS